MQALRKHVDHMITLAKGGSLHERRQALAYIYDKDLVKTLFEQVPDRYSAREGGYTRIQRTMPRKYVQMHCFWGQHHIAVNWPNLDLGVNR